MSSALSEEEANLATYTLQLQQVEAALTNDSSNAELLKLKSDLEEIIALTQQLIETTKACSSSSSNANTKDTSGTLSVSLYDEDITLDSNSHSSEGRKRKSSTDMFEMNNSSSNQKESKIVKTSLKPSSKYPESSSTLLNGNQEDDGEDEEFNLQFHEIKWQTGMQCYAPWSKDGKLNAAVIKEVTSDGLTVTVAFEGYGVVEKCTTGRIKHPKQVSDFIKQRCKRSVMEMQREKKKKKTQLRMQKLKELDESKEQEKKNWKSFMSAGSKSNKNKGINKRSIFKSSDETRFEYGNNYNSGGDCPLSKGMSSRF